jgi:2-polyprenyl-6-methoxyphenol hydroxylase-like FAD-dependent oxidoreductase
MDAGVIIVGGGPTGLLLAGELRLAGARALVLERRQESGQIARASGLGGQILELLRYRGLLARLEAAGGGPVRSGDRFPFGGVHLDLAGLADPPLRALRLPQPQLERVLAERARELEAEIRAGHEVVGVRQDTAAVTAEVHGPEGRYQVTARYLVGCDGARSRVRELAGIAFPGTTYPEVNRLGQVAIGPGVTRLGGGDLAVPGLGTVRAGFTTTDRGVFALGSVSTGELLIQTTEQEAAEVDDDAPITLAELTDSIHRVLGARLPVGEPSRLSRYQFQARQAQRYREGRILLAGDAAHLLPATGAALNLGMLDAVNLAWKLAADVRGWGPPGLLDSYHDERHLAGARALLQTQAQVALRRGHGPAADALRAVFTELLADEQPRRRLAAMIAGADVRNPAPDPGVHPLVGTFAPDLTLPGQPGGPAATSVAALMRPARPVLLMLADRPGLRATASHWQDRVDIYPAAEPAEAAATDADRPADALLVRPDARVAWAAGVGEPQESAGPALDAALTRWFGAPLTAPATAATFTTDRS